MAESWYQRQDAIGGLGIIVEINETLLLRRKHDTGCILAQEWMFGGIECISKKRFVVPLLDAESQPLRRNRETLKQYILPGSTIVSDCWGAYNTLSQEGYNHWKVNHSLNFIDPDDSHSHGCGGMPRITFATLEFGLSTSNNTLHVISS